MGSTLHNRFARLLRLISLFQAGPRYNALQLAQEMGVSRRTIFRDIALLRDLGVAISFDENADGYFLTPGPLQAVTKSLDRDQLKTLLLAGHLSALQLVPETSNSIRDATTSLLGGFSPDLRDELSNLLNACVLDLDVHSAPGRGNVLDTIFAAIRLQRQVRVQVAVEDAGELLQTKIAPYRLRISPDHWRLVGRSSYHRSVCAFDVRLIETAELTEESFDVPRGFYNRRPGVQQVAPS